MLKDKVGIDKKWLPKKFRQWADMLDKDYWGNLHEVMEQMDFQYQCSAKKLKAIYRHMGVLQVKQYGQLIDEEEKLMNSKI